jgi:hypothetical protein
VPGLLCFSQSSNRAKKENVGVSEKKGAVEALANPQRLQPKAMETARSA